jgi:hypothetical protein
MRTIIFAVIKFLAKGLSEIDQLIIADAITPEFKKEQRDYTEKTYQALLCKLGMRTIYDLIIKDMPIEVETVFIKNKVSQRPRFDIH